MDSKSTSIVSTPMEESQQTAHHEEWHELLRLMEQIKSGCSNNEADWNELKSRIEEAHRTCLQQEDDLTLNHLLELRRLEDQFEEQAKALEKSNHDLEQFAYIVSHDLQEPLRLIRSFAGMLARHLGDSLDERASQFLNIMVDNAHHAQDKIQALLEYSRVNRAMKSTMHTFNTRHVVDQAIGQLGLLVHETGAKIHIPVLPEVFGHSLLIARVWQNLLSNAIKFRSDEQPEIWIDVETRDKDWVFSVRDNGIGIDPTYCNQIFEVFSRLHPAKEYPGTGIGLAICKRIVEGHSGQIWCSCETGKGAIFFFSLPFPHR